MDHRSDDVEPDAEVGRDGAVQHLARVQPDPCAIGHAGLPQLALDVEAGEAGAHRVVLVRDRRPEQCQDTAPSRRQTTPS